MGRREEIEKRVTELLEPILEEEGLELYDVEWSPAGRYSYLRIYIDKEGGVTIGDCERVSHQISDLLDVEDFIHTRYFLEVSSPGLTRELKKPLHYQRSLGSLVKVVFKREGAKGQALQGTLLEADDTGFSVLTPQGEVRVEYHEVARAQLEIEGI